MIKSIFLKISIFLVAFCMLCTSVVAFAVEPDDYLGEWFLNSSFVGSPYSFTVSGQFEFPYLDLDAYEYDVGSRDVNVIMLSSSMDSDGLIYYCELLLGDNVSSVENGVVYPICSFELFDLSDGEGEEFEIRDLRWSSDNSQETISQINIISLDDSQLGDFGLFITRNYHRAVPPPEPTNIYQTCYDLLNTWIFGGTVVQGSFHDLVLIFVATICVLLLVALPMLIVWRIIRIWC